MIAGKLQILGPKNPWGVHLTPLPSLDVRGLRDRGLFSDDNIIHKERLKFFFNGNSTNGAPQSSATLEHAHNKTFHGLVGQTFCTFSYKQQGLVTMLLDDNEMAEEELSAQAPLRGCSPQFNKLAEMIRED